LPALLLGFAALSAAHAHTVGPDYIYECPACSSFLRTGSSLSGNTIGAKIYSDGKIVAPMAPAYPNLTKCKNCDTILWLSDMKAIGTCAWGGRCEKKEWESAPSAYFLEFNDLLRFLELDAVKSNKEKEKYVRIRILWSFNDNMRHIEGEIILDSLLASLGKTGKEKSDQKMETEKRIRNEKEVFIQKNKVSWEQNCQRLLELLDTKDVDQKIMAAELYRNLGRFDACMKLLSTVDDQDHAWIAEKLKIECEKKNTSVIMVRSGRD